MPLSAANRITDPAETGNYLSYNQPVGGKMKNTGLKLGNILVVVGLLLILGVAGRADFDGEVLANPMPFWQIVAFVLLGLVMTAIGLLRK